MNATEHPVQPARTVISVENAARLTGLSVASIHRYIKTGMWVEGKQWFDDDGVPRISIDGVEQWVFAGVPTPVVTPQPKPPLPRSLRRQRQQRPPLDLGARTALYRHFDAEGRLLYVGIALSPLGRLRTHATSSHWALSVAKVEIEWHNTRALALQAEDAAIKAERPLHNVTGKPR